MTKTITDFDIQALIDDELDPEHEQFVRTYLKNNAQAAKRFEDLKHQKEILEQWWWNQKNLH